MNRELWVSMISKSIRPSTASVVLPAAFHDREVETQAVVRERLLVLDDVVTTKYQILQRTEWILSHRLPAIIPTADTSISVRAWYTSLSGVP